MDIHFYATLRQVTNAKTVSFDLPETNTAQQILDAVVERFPDMVGMLVDEQGKMLGHCHMFINGRGVTFLVDEMDTVVHSSTDIVKFFPAVGGGEDATAGEDPSAGAPTEGRTPSAGGLRA